MHSIPGFPQRSITHKLFLTGHTVVFVFWGNLLFVPLAQLYQAAYSLFLRQHFSTSQHTNWHFGPDNLLLVLGWVVLCTVGCFSSIPNLCLPDARSIVPPFLQLWQPRMSPDIAKCHLGTKLPLENHCFKQTFSEESGTVASGWRFRNKSDRACGWGRPVYTHVCALSWMAVSVQAGAPKRKSVAEAC